MKTSMLNFFLPLFLFFGKALLTEGQQANVAVAFSNIENDLKTSSCPSGLLDHMVASIVRKAETYTKGLANEGIKWQVSGADQPDTDTVDDRNLDVYTHSYTGQSCRLCVRYWRYNWRVCNKLYGCEWKCGMIPGKYRNRKRHLKSKKDAPIDPQVLKTVEQDITTECTTYIQAIGEGFLHGPDEETRDCGRALVDSACGVFVYEED
jgi:hypothetical protein